MQGLAPSHAHLEALHHPIEVQISIFRVPYNVEVSSCQLRVTCEDLISCIAHNPWISALAHRGITSKEILNYCCVNHGPGPESVAGDSISLKFFRETLNSIRKSYLYYMSDESHSKLRKYVADTVATEPVNFGI